MIETIRRDICDKVIKVKYGKLECEGYFAGVKCDFPVLRLVDYPLVQIEYCWETAKRIADKGTAKIDR